jgi:hypothetical protein
VEFADFSLFHFLIWFLVSVSWCLCWGLVCVNKSVIQLGKICIAFADELYIKNKSVDSY